MFYHSVGGETLPYTRRRGTKQLMRGSSLSGIVCLVCMGSSTGASAGVSAGTSSSSEWLKSCSLLLSNYRIHHLRRLANIPSQPEFTDLTSLFPLPTINQLPPEELHGAPRLVQVRLKMLPLLTRCVPAWTNMDRGNEIGL
eukprot:5049740-Amphidinium_carterae.1